MKTKLAKEKCCIGITYDWFEAPVRATECVNRIELKGVAIRFHTPVEEWGLTMTVRLNHMDRSSFREKLEPIKIFEMDKPIVTVDRCAARPICFKDLVQDVVKGRHTICMPTAGKPRRRSRKVQPILYPC